MKAFVPAVRVSSVTGAPATGVWPALRKPVRVTFWFGATVLLVAFRGMLVGLSISLR